MLSVDSLSHLVSIFQFKITPGRVRTNCEIEAYFGGKFSNIPHSAVQSAGTLGVIV